MNELERTYNIVLDTVRGSRVPLINITERDTNTVYFKISLTSRGNPVKVPHNARVLIYFAKNDNTKVVQSTLDNSVVVQDNKIICKVMSNSISAFGQTDVEVKVYVENKLITPTHFSFNVEESMVCDNDIKSTNEYPLLIEMIDRLENIESGGGGGSIGFDKSEKIPITHNKNGFPNTRVLHYSHSYGVGGYGRGGYGGSNVVTVLHSVEYTGPDDFIISIEDKYKDLEILEIVKTKVLGSEIGYKVTYKDTSDTIVVLLI